MHRDLSAPSLVQRLTQGEPSGFSDVVAWYAEDILRLGYLLLWDREESRDILQETMLRLVRLAREGRLRAENGSLKGLLLKIARNLCIDRLRERQVNFSLDNPDDLFSEPVHPSENPAERADQQQREALFLEALDRLTDTQRAVLVLHDIHDESYAEIAQTLGLSVNNVRTHLWRARERLRRWLEPIVKES